MAKLAAVVVPFRNSWSQKNAATSAAWAGSAKRRSAGKVYFSSHSSSCSPWLAMMSVCG